MPEFTQHSARRRHRLSESERHELDVIDRVLVGNHVEGADDAEIAAFALRLRAERPVIDDAARARLDERFAERIAAERNRVQAGRGRAGVRNRVSTLLARPVRSVGAVATLLVVTAVALSPSISSRLPTETDSIEGPESVGRVLGGDDRAAGAQGAVVQDEAKSALPAVSPPALRTGFGEDAVVPYAQSQSNSAIRRVERSAELTLATPSASLENVADDVIAATDRFGGYVESSSVSGGDAGRAEASFVLRLPSNRFPEALAALSGLAHVRERTQATQDVTDAYERAADRLRTARAESARLRAKLAGTTDDATAAVLRARLRTAESRESARRREMQAMRNRVTNVTVGVSIVADETAEAADRGPISEALHDAGVVLTRIAAISIVSLAIVAPVALLFWAFGAGARRFRRSRGNAAIDAAAPEAQSAKR